MPELNAYTRAATRLVDRLMAAKEQADKSKAMPFGMERVSADTEAKAFAGMNRENKMQFMAQHATDKDPKGIAYTMKVIARGK